MIFSQLPKKIVERDGQMVELGFEIRVVEALEGILEELKKLNDNK